MGDVFKRRCGCGLLLSLRESCARCAAAARSRLHEAGVCDAERPRQPYDNGQHQGNATLYKKPPLGDRPAWLDMCGINSVMRGTDDAESKLQSWRDQWVDSKSFGKWTPERVFGVFGVDRWVDASAVMTGTRRPDGTLVIDEVAMYTPELGERLHKTRQSHCAHARLEIAGTCPECGMAWNDAVNQAADRLYKPEHETPAVGAEVSWEQAKADMVARSEARYMVASEPLTVYAWSDRQGLIQRELMDVMWQPAQMTPELRLWVRSA